MAARHVVIAGGGIAALETVLALRAAPRGATLELTLIAPGEHLVYRPLSVLEPFGFAPVRRYPLAAICADQRVRLIPDMLRAVDGGAREALTGRGGRISYDALVIATGARQRPALERAATYRADQDPSSMRGILADLATGAAGRVAFVVPPGAGWSLPLYELALMTARHVADAGIADVTLTIVTLEDAPLAIFQGPGSAAVAERLNRAGIRVLTSAYVDAFDGRRLRIVPAGETLEADRVIALPVLEGPAIEGLPADRDGFVRADEHHRVAGLDDVYAIGDATTFPVKHGGIATQHADLVAALIARSAGPRPETRPRLRAILLTGEEPLYLQATITGGRSVASSASTRCPWWPPHKIAARHLAPYLADRAPVESPSSPAPAP